MAVSSNGCVSKRVSIAPNATTSPFARRTGCDTGTPQYAPDTGATVTVLMNQGQGAGHFALAPELLDIATRP